MTTEEKAANWDRLGHMLGHPSARDAVVHHLYLEVHDGFAAMGEVVDFIDV